MKIPKRDRCSIPNDGILVKYKLNIEYIFGVDTDRTQIVRNVTVQYKT